MSTNKHEKLLDGLLRRSLVRPGFRPRTEQEEDAMLEAMGHIEISREKRDRMLRKIRGEESYDLEQSDPVVVEPSSDAVEKLAPMFRDEGDLSPEVQSELDDLEQETAEGDFDEDEDPDGSES